MQNTHSAKTPVAPPERCRELCTCGLDHPTVDSAVYSGRDAFEVLASDLMEEGGAGQVLLLEDENTRQAAGDAVCRELEKAGTRFDRMTLPGTVTATEKAAGKVLERAGGRSLIIAVGAGTINDLGKYTAANLGIPYWTVPTAPSMNGYTSSIAAIKIAGVKRTLPAPPPKAVYVHPDVIKDAPLILRQAGYCDIMAKSVSDFDWRIDSMLFGGRYCRLPAEIVSGAEEKFRERTEGIFSGDEETVMALMEGLLASGASMSLAGSSAPASGGEHLFSHFLDMREAVTGRKPELHGLQVAAGIILSAACYRGLAGVEADKLVTDAEGLYFRDAAAIADTWGEMAPEVEKRFALKKDQLMALNETLPRHWPELHRLMEDVRTPEFYLDLFRRTGHPLTLESLQLSDEEFLLAANNARAIRERITILDIAAHVGILESVARKTLNLLK